MTDLSLDHLQAKFAEYLQAANYAKATVKEYLTPINKFYAFMEQNQIKEIELVSKELVQDFQIMLSQEKNKYNRSSTIGYQNITMKGLIYFFNFLFDHEFIPKNPTKGVKYAKAPKTLPRNILSEAEAKKILDQPNIQTQLGFRDRCILELLYSSGIRAAELRNIDLADVDFHTGTLIVRQGKGDKDRYVPIGRTACQLLENYVHHVRQFFIQDGMPTNALFVSGQGGRLGKSRLDMVIRKYAKAANIKKIISCHSWRHTCATHLINRGMDVRHVQALLGHESLNSTQIYTRVAIRDLKRVIQKYHPRERAQ